MLPHKSGFSGISIAVLELLAGGPAGGPEGGPAGGPAGGVGGSEGGEGGPAYTTAVEYDAACYVGTSRDIRLTRLATERF